MSQEKTQGAGTAPKKLPAKIRSQITFLPEGKNGAIRDGKLPYEDHGKKSRFLTSRSTMESRSTTALRRQLCLHTCHVWIKEGAENLSPNG